MRKYYVIFIIVLFTFFGCTSIPKRHDTIFQVSTINALLEGDYDGSLTFHELKKQGNFGLGTFNSLDGEMIALDGTFYQITYDGTVHIVQNTKKTPFSVITSFEPDKKIDISQIQSLEALKNRIDKNLPTKNIFFAIKIEGLFSYIKTRSVPKQQKPYPKLLDVIKKQSYFEFANIEGTIVGFFCPSYVKNINVPGYHFHFIDKDHKKGGHVLDCKIQSATIYLDYSSSFFMQLPNSETFYSCNLDPQKKGTLEKVEKEPAKKH
ncbi:acetolactate decarboxylase [Chlamydiota bacterium]